MSIPIAVTGYGPAADRERSHAVTGDRHFAKPIDLHVLERVLRELDAPTPPPV